MNDDIAAARRRKMFAVANSIGLRRDERIELAQYLLRRDVSSWKDLTDDQNRRMLDAMEGYELVKSLLEMRSVAENGDDASVAQ